MGTTFTWTSLSQTEYEDQRLDFIKEHEGLRELAYLDPVGIPTIGYGYNLRDENILEEVINQIFYQGQTVSTSIEDADEPFIILLQIAVEQNYASDAALQTALNIIMDAREAFWISETNNDPSIDSPAETRSTFTLNDGAEMDSVYTESVQTYEDRVDAWLSGIPVNAEERIALLSLSYNGVLDSSNSLKFAIQNDNRAEAFYEIRYNSNALRINGVLTSGSDPTLTQTELEIGFNGLATRRYAESEQFGLYNSSPLNEAEARQIFEAQTRHWEKIEFYDIRYKNYLGSSTSTDTLSNGAEDFLTNLYANNTDVDKVFVDYKNVNGTGTETNDLDFRLMENGSSRTQNILLLGGDGDDTLRAGGGDDYLRGEDDDDFLYGGAGNDHLFGDDGIDELYGEDGNDYLIGGSGNNILDGGSNDVVASRKFSRKQGIDELTGGDTVDYSDVDSGQYIQVNLSNATHIINGQTLLANKATVHSGGTFATDTLNDIENIFDTVNSDIIIGSSGQNVFHYTGGNDFYYGGDGSDYFHVSNIPAVGETLVIDGGTGTDQNYAFIDAFSGSVSRQAVQITDLSGVSVSGTRYTFGQSGMESYIDVTDNIQVSFDNGRGGTIIDGGRRGSGRNITIDGGKSRLEIDIYDENDRFGGGGSSGSGTRPNITSVINPSGDSKTVTVTQAGTGELLADIDIPIGQAWDVNITILYIDGVPVAVFNSVGDIFETPELGGIAGLKPVEDLSDILLGDSGQGSLIGGQAVTPFNNPIDDWVYSQTTFTNVMDDINNVYAAFSQAEQTGSPIVLDLDGDGIELISLDNSDVFWDLDEDGFAERSGWVNSDDGLLAIDLDGDGVIKDHTELFGNLTEDGFSVLSAYDTNLDNVIDANDAQFGDLLIWRDLDQNGIGGENELFTLTELNITSINLNAAIAYQVTIEGNPVTHTSSYTYDDGVNPVEIRDAYDVWFQYDDKYTLYNESFDLDPITLSLPNFAGYGNLPSLQIAMSLDNDLNDSNSLLSLVTEFYQKDFLSLFSDDGSVLNEIRDIMFRWTGVDGVDPTSRGVWVDARELEFMESFVGEGFLQYGAAPNPGALSGESANRAFETSILPIFGRIVAQSSGSELFLGNLEYNAFTDRFTGFTGFNQTALDNLVAKSNDGTVTQNKVEFWEDVIRMVDHSIGVNTLSTSDFNQLEAAIILSDNTLTIQQLLDRIQHDIDRLESWNPDGDYIFGTSSDDIYTGSVGDDFYSGGGGNDTLSGGIGNDKFYGGGGNDILNGQAGNDYFMGDGGDDTYLYFLGHGDDILLDSSGNDKILFGAGITVSDLSFVRVGTYDLTVQLDPAVGYGSITIQGHFSGGVIETLEFSDGSTLDMNSIDHTYIGTSVNETIYGVRTDLGGSGVDTLYGNGGDDVIRGTSVAGSSYTAQNVIYGGDGNDTIYADNAGDYLDGGADDDVINGLSGVDTLIGGTGDDLLKGGYGDDIYVFNYGDGNDIIYDTNNNDTILMGAGIDASMITATRLNINDLLLEIDGGAGGTIMLQYHTYGVGNVIETMEFSDGSTLDLSSFDLTLNGTSANEVLYGVNIGGTGVDTIYGYFGDDTIYGYRSTVDTNENFLYAGAGDDIVYGAHGNDIIEGNHGNDTIQAYNGNDQITGGAGDDTLRGYNGDDVYIFNYGDGNDFIEEKSGTDKILFGAGITAAMIDVTRLNINDLMIEIDGGLGGSIELNWHTYGAGYVVETLEFYDGSTIDLTALDLTMNGTSGNDVLYGVTYGGSGVDTIYGNDGNDIIYGYRSGVDTNENTIFGGNGNDAIQGANGNDIIEGGDGNDTIWGLGGDDVITGGAGVDSIYGSAGADTFVFEAASAFLDVDIIQDFKTSQNDVLDISDLLIGYDPLTDAITDFVQITDSGSTSIVSVDADGGADNFVQIATLNWVNGLTDEETLETSGNLIAA